MELASPVKRRRQEGADDSGPGTVVRATQAPDDLKRELRSAQMTLEKERLAHRREMRLLKLKLKKESEHNSSLRRRMEKLLSEEKELRGEVDSLRSQMEGLSESAEQLKASLKRASTRADRAEQDRDVAQAELNTLRAQLSAYEETNPEAAPRGGGDDESSSGEVEIVGDDGGGGQASGDEYALYSDEESEEGEKEEGNEEEGEGEEEEGDRPRRTQSPQNAADGEGGEASAAGQGSSSVPREQDLERQLSRAVADAKDAWRRVRWLETHLDVQRERARAADMAEAKIQQLEDQLKREREQNSKSAVVGVDADAAAQQLDQAFSLVQQAVGEKDEEVKSVVGGVLVLRRLLQKERHEVELLAQSASEGKEALAGAKARARSAEEAQQQAQQAEMRARARAEEAEATSREASRRAAFHERECASYKELADAYAAEAKSLREWAQRTPGAVQGKAAAAGGGAGGGAGQGGVADAQGKEVDLLRSKVERMTKEIERLEQQSSSASAGASASGGVVGDLQKRVEGLESALRGEETKRARLEKQLEASESQCARLEAEVGRGSFNPATTKVVHLARNPAREAREQWSNERAAELETLRTEVETLRAALEASEQGREAGVQDAQQQQQGGPFAGASTASAAATAATASAAATTATPAAGRRTTSALGRGAATPARAPPATPLTAAATALARAPSAMGAGDLQKRVDRLKQVFSDKIGTLREAVYLLTGYKVDMTTTDTKATRLRLRSMYAEHEEDHLLFQLEDGELQMLETEFTRQLDKRLFVYLTRCDSVPAFLSNVTLHLFDQQTINPGALAAAAAASQG